MNALDCVYAAFERLGLYFLRPLLDLRFFSKSRSWLALRSRSESPRNQLKPQLLAEVEIIRFDIFHWLTGHQKES